MLLGPVTDGKWVMALLYRFGEINCCQSRLLSKSSLCQTPYLRLQLFLSSLMKLRESGMLIWLSNFSYLMMLTPFLASHVVASATETAWFGPTHLKAPLLWTVLIKLPCLYLNPNQPKEHQRLQAHGQFWQKIWSLQIPNKLKTFAWRASRNILPTKANLCSRGVLDDPTCDACGLIAETSGHLF